MMMAMIYRTKALIRWVCYTLRIKISYHKYGYDCGGYQGWYESRGRCIAFRENDGRIQFHW
jgi:hypothetical protein